MTRSPRSILYGQHAAPGGVSPPVQCGAVIFKVAGPNTGLSWYNSAGPITAHRRGGHSQWIAKAMHSLIEPLRKAAILCGGCDTRLYDVSKILPKFAVALEDRPIIWHIKKIYAALAQDMSMDILK